MTLRRQTLALITSIVLHASGAQAGSKIEIKLAYPVPSGTIWDKALEEIGAEWQEDTGGLFGLWRSQRHPFRCYRSTTYMHEFGLGPVIAATVITQGADSLRTTQEANRLADSMRGTIVPTKIFDRALSVRNDYRQRIAQARDSTEERD